MPNQPAADCRAPAAEESVLAELRRTEPASFGAMFLDRVARTPAAEAYRRPGPDGAWQSQTWAATGTAVTEIAAGLLALGLRPQERVAILAGTRTEWIEADFGIMCAGGATTTVYPTGSPDEVAHILSDSASRFAVVERPDQLDRVLTEGSPVEHAVVIDGTPTGTDPRVRTLATLRADGRDLLAAKPDAVTTACAAIRPDDLATLIYTSGTTGLPKGVRVAHRSWIYQGLAIEAMGFLHPDDLGYLWLPLAHAFGKALLSCQLSVGFAFAVDGDVGRLVDHLPAVRPTIIPAVPRIFEKVYAGVLATVRDGNPVAARLFGWGVGVGARTARARREGRRPGPLLAAQHRIADRLVLARIRARFGGRLRFFISGAAALSPGIGEWFDAVGLPVLEGYGLTETCATTFFNRPGRPEYGTVGRPLPGTRVTLAEDGEILVHGPGVMQAYHHLPEATAATLTDGWLHTGDIGTITEAGSLAVENGDLTPSLKVRRRAVETRYADLLDTLYPE
jgi:long-chain acyl-CoA synthetase